MHGERPWPGVEQARAGKLSDGKGFFEHLRQKIRSAAKSAIAAK
jgi:hypothetical protein